MKRLCLFIILINCLVACKKTTTTQSALGSLTSSSCVIGKWSDQSLPLNIKISSEFTADFDPASEVNGLNPLEQMAAVWNAPISASKTLVTTPFPIASTTGFDSTSSFRDNEIGIYKSHNWFPDQNRGVLAITQFYGIVSNSPGLGDYIDLTHADIIINYRDYGQSFTMSALPTAAYDLPTVVLHEMGHLLGLCHEKNKPSVMAPYYLTKQRSLQNFDTDIIKDIYQDGALSALASVKAKNTNALKSKVGTEIRGVIELKADGECAHYVEGKKIYQHKVNLKK